MRQDASVGIIGGADGPTAIFVTGSPLWAGAALLAILALAAAALFWLHRRKR